MLSAQLSALCCPAGLGSCVSCRPLLDLLSYCAFSKSLGTPIAWQLDASKPPSMESQADNSPRGRRRPSRACGCLGTGKAVRTSMPIRCCAASRTRRGPHVDITLPPPYPPLPVFPSQLGYAVWLVLATRHTYSFPGCCHARRHAQPSILEVMRIHREFSAIPAHSSPPAIPVSADPRFPPI